MATSTNIMNGTRKLRQIYLKSSLFILLFILSTTSYSCKTDGTGAGEQNNMISQSEAHNFIIKYDRAWKNRDTVTIKKMMSQRYIYFTSKGLTNNRDKMLSWFSPSDKYKLNTVSRNDIDIVLSRDVAVIKSHWVGTGTFNGKYFEDNQCCGLVLQKFNNHIKIISEHCTQITK